MSNSIQRASTGCYILCLCQFVLRLVQYCRLATISSSRTRTRGFRFYSTHGKVQAVVIPHHRYLQEQACCASYGATALTFRLFMCGRCLFCIPVGSFVHHVICLSRYLFPISVLLFVIMVFLALNLDTYNAVQGWRLAFGIRYGIYVNIDITIGMPYGFEVKKWVQRALVEYMAHGYNNVLVSIG